MRVTRRAARRDSARETLRVMLLSTLLLTVGVAAPLGTTSASFSDDASVPANTVVTGALEDPQAHTEPVTAGAVSLTWDAAPTGGDAPTYTVTRSKADGTDAAPVYTGADPAYIDHGGIPAELSTLEMDAISTRSGHSLALDTDHHVYTWGNNDHGQLGTGDHNDRWTPTPLAFPDGVTITTVVAGTAHSLALDSEHRVYVWGGGLYGQPDRTTPTPLTFPAGVAITSVAAGGDHSLALDTDHRVWAWGANDQGQLGTGDKTDRMTPTLLTVPAGVTIASVFAGIDHSLAIDTNHHVYSWGNNDRGQLGTGDKTDRMTPTPLTVPAGVTISSVAAGNLHSLALDTDHHVWAWGSNDAGQLGTGDQTERLTPTLLTFPAEVSLTAVAAGRYHSLAIDGEHRMYAWGYNDSGQLGIGDLINRATPTPVALPTGVDITSLAAGDFDTLGLAGDHAAYAWGDNTVGQLGTGNQFHQRTPTRVGMTCPTRSTFLPDGTTCSLQSGRSYRYTVTTTVGGWTRTSAPLTVSPEAQ